MEGIGAEPKGNITPRESGQTFAWSLITREFGKPLEAGKQMTAVATPAGAPTYEAIDWNSVNWKKVKRNVRRLQARIVKASGLSRVRLTAHARFLGGWGPAMAPGYPTGEEIW
jgi:hypothetical protein